MATEFNHNGNIYEIINDDEVRLTKLSSACYGEVYIPKYAKYNDKRYIVTVIGNEEVREYYGRKNIHENDKRKKPEYVEFIAGTSYVSVFHHIASKPYKYDLVPDNKSITALIIPDTITRINRSAFNRCLEIRELIIPESVTCIDPYAFAFCVKLTKLTIPKGLKKISEGTFLNCRDLAELTIPNGVRVIEKFAFNYNDYYRDGYNETLTQLTIPSSVEEIGEGAFRMFRKLEQVDIYNDPSELMIAANAFPSTAKINYLGKKQEKEEAQKKTEPAVKTITESEVVEAKPTPKAKEESKVAKPVAKADGGYSKIQVNFHFNSETAEKKVKMTLTKKALDYAVTNGYDALEVAFDADRIVLRGGGNVLLQKVMDKSLTITGYEWIE